VAALDDAFVVKLAVGPADRVGMQSEAARHLACAGQALTGAKIATCNAECNLRAELLAETDLAGMNEPEAHKAANS
jgi:hypothetical protein